MEFVRVFLRDMEDDFYFSLKKAIFDYKRMDPAREEQIRFLQLPAAVQKVRPDPAPLHGLVTEFTIATYEAFLDQLHTIGTKSAIGEEGFLAALHAVQEQWVQVGASALLFRNELVTSKFELPCLLEDFCQVQKSHLVVPPIIMKPFHTADSHF